MSRIALSTLLVALTSAPAVADLERMRNKHDQSDHRAALKDARHDAKRERIERRQAYIKALSKHEKAKSRERALSKARKYRAHRHDLAESTG